MVRFEVSDTGTGIEAQNLSRIFSPFEQAGDGRHQRGTGPGLSISQRLVRLMGGELMVESTIGQGSNFWFEIPLPVAEPQQMTTTTERTIVGYEGESRRLLVVDDNAVNRAYSPIRWCQWDLSSTRLKMARSHCGKPRHVNLILS